MYARRLGADRAGALNPFALLASQGVALAFGSDAPVTGLDPWVTVRAAANHHMPGSSVSVRAAFAAATRGGWRAGGVKDGLMGTLVPGAPASYAVWDVADLSELEASAPSDAVRRWSTDPRSRVPGLPRLGPDRHVAPLSANRAQGRSDPWLGASGGSTAGCGPGRTPRSSRWSMTTPPAKSPCKTMTTTIKTIGSHAGLETDLGPQDADTDREPEHGDDRLARFGNRAREVGTYVGQRLVQLSAALLVWLGNELRKRLPQLARALRPRLTRLGAASLGRFAALFELSRVQLVVGRHHRIRGAGLGADPPGHHTAGRLRLRLPVRLGVLPAVDPLGQHPGGRHTPAGAGAGVRGVSGDFRSVRRRGTTAARVADLVRGVVGGAGVVEVDSPIRRVSVGCGGRRPNGRPVFAVGPAGQRSTAVVGDRADRLQCHRHRVRGRVVVASVPSAAAIGDPRRGGRHAARCAATRDLHLPDVFRHNGDLAASPPLRHRIGQRAHRERGVGTGQCAQAGFDVQRAAARGAG